MVSRVNTLVSTVKRSIQQLVWLVGLGNWLVNVRMGPFND